MTPADVALEILRRMANADSATWFELDQPDTPDGNGFLCIDGSIALTGDEARILAPALPIHDHRCSDYCAATEEHMAAMEAEAHHAVAEAERDD
jgi:hypothetical protein